MMKPTSVMDPINRQYKKMQKARDIWAGYCRRIKADEYLLDSPLFHTNYELAYDAYKTESDLLRKMIIEKGIPIISIVKGTQA